MQNYQEPFPTAIQIFPKSDRWLIVLGNMYQGRRLRVVESGYEDAELCYGLRSTGCNTHVGKHRPLTSINVTKLLDGGTESNNSG